MLEDGRQSEQALAIRKGALRLMAAHGVMALPEVTLASGRRTDLMGASSSGEIWIIEIKSSRQDLLSDQKWPDYRAACDRLFFATSPDVDLQLFPDDAGLIVADAFGGELVRHAPHHPLPGPTRKALLLRLARIGAQRFMAAQDPWHYRDDRLV